MARWRVQLDGNSLDLAQFPHWFPNGDVHAITRDDKTYLVGPTFEALATQDEVYEIALRVLDELSGVIALLAPPFKRPTLQYVWEETDSGRQIGHAFASAHMEGRSALHAGLQLANADGDTMPSDAKQTQAQALLAAARDHKHLMRAVTSLGDPSPTWSRLYVILEEVETHFRPRDLVQAGLCSGNQLKRFKASANSADVGGKEARHGSGRFDPPSSPMALREATTFVAGVVARALQHRG